MSYKNIRLHPVLRIIYFFLRVYAWVGTRVFYRRRTVLGAEHLRFDGPAIVISNHPSTLMDVLNVGIPIRQEMFFLANYGLFKHPVSNWLLTRLFCIPVKRREDVAEGEDRNNDAAFEASFQHLEASGILYIAAEGVSWMNRWVRPFKTGTARIAFSVEQRNAWNLDMKIIPVGLSYNTPNLFRSDLVVHFGAPVKVGEWRQAWQQDPEKAVDDFTSHLEQTVRSLTIDTRDETGERVVGHWEEMLQHSAPVSAEAAFHRSQNIVAQHIDNQQLVENTESYFSRLAKAGANDLGVQMAFTGIKTGQMLMLMLGLPFFIAGWIFWVIPCFLPWWLAKKMKLYIGYDSNVKVLAGSFTFGIALWWAPWIVGMHNQWSAALVILACIALGYFVEQYQDVWKKWQSYRRFRNLPVVEQQALQAQRAEIIQKLF